ncbi:MAG: glycosyltransferase family 4 protein [Crocinitomicaceae bacterium]
MGKLKIIHTLYSGLGGHGSVVFPLIENGFASKYDHSIVFYGVEKTTQSYHKKCSDLKLNHFSIIKKPRQYLKAFSEFKKILNNTKPSVIIVHNSELIVPAARFSRKNKDCTVFYVEHQDSVNKTKLQNFLSIYALKKATGIVCLTDTDKKELLEKKLSKTPIQVIPNGVRLNTGYKRDYSRNTIIGMASRMTPTKDHSLLLIAFKNIVRDYPKITLEIAGDGQTFSAVKALAHELKISENIVFHGMLSDKEMILFYQKITINVLATTSETMSTAILQAMASGLPVITSNIVNNKRIIENGKNGWLYKNKDADDLTEKLRYAINNPKAANKIGMTAQKHIELNYSVENMIQLYSEFIFNEKSN